MFLNPLLLESDMIIFQIICLIKFPRRSIIYSQCIDFTSNTEKTSHLYSTVYKQLDENSISSKFHTSIFHNFWYVIIASKWWALEITQINLSLSKMSSLLSLNSMGLKKIHIAIGYPASVSYIVVYLSSLKKLVKNLLNTFSWIIMYKSSI